MAHSKESRPKMKTGFELWQETVNAALIDTRWQAYDCDIQRIVSQFNRHLSESNGYVPLDWHLVKAMVWTESGGPNNRAWRDNPIQIGNPGDPGLAALLAQNEGGPLIIPPELQNRLTIASVRTSPQMNICAGVAYLLMRLAKYNFATVIDEKDQHFHDVLVKPGDSLDKIAKSNATTVDTLKKLDSGIVVLSPGKILKYRKASIRKIISRWTAISTTSIARLYNVGDPAYAIKLSYCLSIMQKISKQESSCAI